MNDFVQDNTDIDVIYLGTVNSDGIVEGVKAKEMFMTDVKSPSGLC
jgi:hypothetical protein